MELNQKNFMRKEELISKMNNFIKMIDIQIKFLEYFLQLLFK